MRKTLSILILFLSMTVMGQSPLRITGTANQLWFPVEKTIGNGVRLNFTAQFLTPPDERFGEITLSPTWQMFPKHSGGDMDGYLQQLHDDGVWVMVNVLNGFNKKYGGALKQLPKDYPGAPNLDMQSWTLFKTICEQVVLRYGSVKNDPRIDIAHHPTSWTTQERVSGLGTMDAFQILNEVDNNWVNPPQDGRLTGVEYAHLLKFISDAVWDIDPNMTLVTAPMYQFHEWWIDDVITTWENNYGQFPHYDPVSDTGIIISFNTYLHGCSYGTNCDAPKPTDPVHGIPPMAEDINQWAVDNGAWVIITEHGCNVPRQADIGCFNYAGLSDAQDQAQFLIESTDEWLRPNDPQWRIIKAFAYQGQDDPNEWRFGTTGLLKSGDALQEKGHYQIVKQDWSVKYPRHTWRDEVVTPPVDTTENPVDTTTPPVFSDTVFVTDTVVVIQKDTVYLEESDIRQVNLVGGKYYIIENGDTLTGKHFQFKEGIERGLNIQLRRPESIVEMGMDNIQIILK